MKQPIPYQKLSKKAKREMDAKQRKTWDFSPVTRMSKNEKIYNRKRISKAMPPDEIRFLFCTAEKLASTSCEKAGSVV